MAAASLLNWELMHKRVRQRLARQPGWIVIGVLGPLILTCWAILTPFDLRAEYYDFKRTAILLCAWYLGFAALYAITHWLRPAGDGDEDELQPAPLSALQFFLHRSADLCALPLFCMLLTLPLYGVLLIYFGDPYNSASAGTPYYYYDLGFGNDASANPWSWRAFFLGLNVVAATWLPLSLGVLINETVNWRPLRVILLLAMPTGLWFVVERAEIYFRRSYRQTYGIEPWLYVVVFAVLIALPFLFGFLKARGRLILATFLAVVLAAGAALPFVNNVGGADVPWVPAIGRALGHLRAVLGYFAGHLSLEKNVDLLLHRYQSMVLTTDITPGNLIPRRVAMWVGAGLYPPLIALASFLMLGLGVALRKRHPTE